MVRNRTSQQDVGTEEKMPENSSGRGRMQSEKRAQIVAAATELFFKEGYGRTTMDRVHARVGGSKRTLYKYFASKEQLFEAIVTQVSDKVLAALTPALDADDVQGALTVMGTNYLNVLTSPDGIALYRAMVSEAPHFPELARTFFKNGPGRADAHLAAFLRARAQDGQLAVSDPEGAAAQLLGAIRGDVHFRAVLNARVPRKKEIAAAAAAAVETFLHGHAR